MAQVFDFLIESTENSLGFAGFFGEHKDRIKFGFDVILLAYYSVLYFWMGQKTFEGIVGLKVVTYVMLVGIGAYGLWKNINIDKEK